MLCAQVAGYSIINVFGLVGNTLEQPVSPSQKHVLNSGCFQLPLYLGTISRDKTLNAKSLDFATLVPCASLLVSTWLSFHSYVAFDEACWLRMMCIFVVTIPRFASFQLRKQRMAQHSSGVRSHGMIGLLLVLMSHHHYIAMVLWDSACLLTRT